MIKNSYLKKLIVFEGIDGAGCGTQSELLFDLLRKAKIPVEKLAYPDYRGPIGRLIHQFLHKKYEFSVETQFMLYFLDFLKDRERIKKWKKEGKTVISDRYFSSTLAYQCQKGFPLKIALKIAKIFQLPKPNLIFYLKVSSETSMRRKYEEKRNLDRHEGDKKFLTQLLKSYEKLIKHQFFGKWKIIDGEKPIEEVFKQVKKSYEL